MRCWPGYYGNYSQRNGACDARCWYKPTRSRGAWWNTARYAADLPVVGNQPRPATDNALGAAMMSLFKAVAHPGDRYAREHGDDAAARTVRRGTSQWDLAMRRLQEQLYHEGFEAAAVNGRALAADDFSSHRRRQFIELARNMMNRVCRMWMNSSALPKADLNEGGASGVVHVMTVHKAKGLTFDVTLVPDLEGSRLDAVEALHASHDHGEVEWVMDLPRGLCGG